MMASIWRGFFMNCWTILFSFPCKHFIRKAEKSSASTNGTYILKNVLCFIPRTGNYIIQRPLEQFYCRKSKPSADVKFQWRLLLPALFLFPDALREKTLLILLTYPVLQQSQFPLRHLKHKTLSRWFTCVMEYDISLLHLAGGVIAAIFRSLAGFCADERFCFKLVNATFTVAIVLRWRSRETTVHVLRRTGVCWWFVGVVYTSCGCHTGLPLTLTFNLIHI